MRLLLWVVVLCAVHAISDDSGQPKCTTPRVHGQSLKNGNTLHVQKEKKLKQKALVKKYHKFNGVTVFDSQLLEDSDQKGHKRIESQIVDVPANFNTVAVHTPAEAAAACMTANNFAPGTGEPRDRQLFVKFDEDSCEFKLAHLVSDFFRGQPARPACFVEDSTLAILQTWDNLQHVLVPAKGGNARYSWDFYGSGATPDATTTVRTSLPLLDVTPLDGGACSLSNSVTETRSCRHLQAAGSLVVVQNCITDGFNYSDLVSNPTHGGLAESNGAINVEADAHAFATATFAMYQAYTGGPPLAQKLITQVHYGYNYDNAFYDNGVMTFGDGSASMFYPLVSLDIMAHEVSHGYTAQNSNLVYSGQSGGMNEAFSDMGGEAAEFFFYGTNDFRCGADVVKSPNVALRYLYNPPLDGKSIDNVAAYTSTINVHYSSGIFNKAFYNLATSPNLRWNTKLAFQAFQIANELQWTSGSTFQAGAQGVYNAVQNILGWNGEDVQKAFAPTGIVLGPVNAVELFNEPSIAIATGQQIVRSVTLSTEMKADEYLRIITTGNVGDPDVYVSLIPNPSISVTAGTCTDCIAKGIVNGQEDVKVPGSFPSNQVIYITVGAFTAVSNMRLVVQRVAFPSSLTRNGLLCSAPSECESNQCESGVCGSTTLAPTRKPTSGPTSKPTSKPTSTPTSKPTRKPTSKPTSKPSKSRGSG
jgi:Zn-dependent metalloprotease